MIFYAATIVRYALSVALFIQFCIAIYVLSGGSESPWVYLAACTITTIVLSGFNFRYSRVIQLYWLTPSIGFTEKNYAETYRRSEALINSGSNSRRVRRFSSTTHITHTEFIFFQNSEVRNKAARLTAEYDSPRAVVFFFSIFELIYPCRSPRFDA